MAAVFFRFLLDDDVVAFSGFPVAVEVDLTFFVAFADFFDSVVFVLIGFGVFAFTRVTLVRPIGSFLREVSGSDGFGGATTLIGIVFFAIGGSGLLSSELASTREAF